MASQMWLLRHGAAEPHGTRPDSQRRLTERGESQSRDAGRALVALGVAFEAVLSSPKVRALDTARLAAAAWGGVPAVCEQLAGGFDAEQALDLLRDEGVAASGRLLAVGHEPDLSTVVAQLTGARVDLKKGGLAVMRIEGSRAELLVLLRPQELTLIAGGVGDGAQEFSGQDF